MNDALQSTHDRKSATATGRKWLLAVVGAIVGAGVVALIVVTFNDELGTYSVERLTPGGDESRQDAQSSLRNALSAVKTFYADRGTYEGFDSKFLERYVHPGYQLVPADVISKNHRVISGQLKAESVQFAVNSIRNHGMDMCFAIRDVAVGEGSGTFYASKKGGVCTAASFDASLDFSELKSTWEL